jgi:hypothetical protein
MLRVGHENYSGGQIKGIASRLLRR